MQIRVGRSQTDIRFPSLDSKPLRVRTADIAAHLSQFEGHYEVYGPHRMSAQFFRSREKQYAGYILFGCLKSLGHGTRNCLTERLRLLWQDEERDGALSSWRSDVPTVDVFEALCELLQTRNFDHSPELFRQLSNFVLLTFENMARHDPRSAARCLVALDSLRREMAPVIERLALDGRSLAVVVDEDPYFVNLLARETRRELEYYLGRLAWDDLDMPRRQHRDPLDEVWWDMPRGQYEPRRYLPNRNPVYRRGLSRPPLYDQSAFEEPNGLKIIIKPERSWPMSFSPTRHYPVLPAAYESDPPIDFLEMLAGYNRPGLPAAGRVGRFDVGTGRMVPSNSSRLIC